MFLIAVLPAPQLPIANADDLRGLPPGDLFGYGTQDHFLYFHRPLPGGSALRFMPHTGMRETQPLQSGHFMC
jgi:hypothetical protein